MFNLKDGEKVAEDVDVSVKGNFVQYHVKNNDSEVWVINDFDRVSISVTIRLGLDIVPLCHGTGAPRP